ncbi:UNVERIFIED_CONTAM: hypothetical protein K2H54_044617 [Gekko kuhli]
MSPNEAEVNVGIIRLLLHFQWTWVGLFAVDDDTGEQYLKVLEPLLSKNKICLALIQKIPKSFYWDDPDYFTDLLLEIYLPFKNSKAQVFIFYGESELFPVFYAIISPGYPTHTENHPLGKVWIMTPQADFAVSGLNRVWGFQFFHGTFAFTIHSNELHGFQNFVQELKPYKETGNSFVKDFWEQAFDCFYPDPQEPGDISETCTGEERLDSLSSSLFEMNMTGHSYSIYNAVYAIAHAIHALHSSRSNRRAMDNDKIMGFQDLWPWQVHPFLQVIAFNNSVGERLSFNDKWEMEGGLDIMNMATFANTSFRRTKIGTVNPNSPEGQELIIHENMIVWQTIFHKVSIVIVVIVIIITTTTIILPVSMFYLIRLSCKDRTKSAFKP